MINNKSYSNDKVRAYIDRVGRVTDGIENVSNLHVYISEPNKKGAPHSVSLVPIIDCPCCMACKNSCYDMRHDMIYSNVTMTRAINHIIATKDRTRFFREISGRCQSFDRFRWHIGGDILDYDYWCGIVRVANENPHCKFHIFTKCVGFINRYLDEGHTIPSNINLRLSQWSDLEIHNPHNLNVARVVLDGEFVRTDDTTALCNGNCTKCSIHSDGCFNNDIKTIFLPIH